MTDNVFDGVPFIVDPNCPPGVVYLINPDALHHCPHVKHGPWMVMSKNMLDINSLYEPQEVNMSKFSTFVARVRVVLNAAPLYLVGAATAVTVVTEEVSKQFPGAAGPLVHYTGPVLAALAAVVAIVRRVTPVSKEDRGLL